MSFSFGLSPWLLVLSTVVAGALAYWLYRHTTPELSAPKRAGLGLLRFAALFLILFLLFEPILRLVDRDEKKAVLAVLVDNTQSLVMTSSTDSSAAHVRDRIRTLFEHLPAALRNADIQIFSFANDLGAREVQLDSLAFDGTRTNIARALEQLRERLNENNLRGAVLLSDGQYNTGRNPLYVADRYPVPIYTAVLGDTARHRDIQIRRVITNDIAYVDTELPVQIALRAEGYGGEPITVTLLQDGQTLSSKRAELPQGSSEITIDLTMTPEEEGLHRYSVAVSRLDGEATYRNNVESFTVRVLRTQRKVLLLAAAPSPDVSSIRQLLTENSTFDVHTYVQKSRGVFYEGPMPSSLDDYDVIVMAGYPGRAAAPEDMQRVRVAAEAGTPIFLLFGRSMHIQFVDEQFSDVLPAVPDRVRSGFVEASFAPTSDAATHPIMMIPDASTETWLRLPPLIYSQTRWRASPDARVLARTRVRGVDLDDPLLVIRRRTQSRSAALLGAETWRWRNVSEDLDHLAPLWPTLFANTLEWLSAREEDQPVRVVPVRDLFGGGEMVELTGQVYDESLNPLSDATVEVQVTSPDGTVFPYVMQPIGNGRYTLDAGTFPEGTYRFEAQAQRNESMIGDDEGSFAVGALTLEFKETRANAALMRQIAQRSGGDLIDPDHMETFTSGLAASGAFAPVVVEAEREIELRRRYIFLAMVIGLLATEWFIRKRSGMV